MRKLIIILTLLFVSAYILGQLPGDGTKVLLVASVVGFGAYMVGKSHGYQERIQTAERSIARLHLERFESMKG